MCVCVCVWVCVGVCVCVCVAIGRYRWFAWVIVVGIGVSVLMVHGRWTDVAWQPRATVSDSHQTGSDPYGDTGSWAVSLAMVFRGQ